MILIKGVKLVKGIYSRLVLLVKFYLRLRFLCKKAIILFEVIYTVKDNCLTYSLIILRYISR